MNEIRFRGIRTDNGKWVFGYYIKHLNYTPCVNHIVMPEEYQHFIMQDGFSDWNMPRNTRHFEVVPETVGQLLLTGADFEVYEDDEIRMHYFAFENGMEIDKEVVGVACLDMFGTYTMDKEGNKWYWVTYLELPEEEIEVIGNIHE